MSVVNEHPNVDVRKLYAGEVALRVGLAVPDLVAVAQRGGAPREIPVVQRRRVGFADNAEFVAVAMLLQRWNDVAAWLIEDLFADDVARRAFLALAQTDGVLSAALDVADPEARELLERAAVADLEADPFVEACNLIAAAVRRELARPLMKIDPDSMRAHSEAKRSLELLDDPIAAQEAAGSLLGWLERCGEERA
jgi:DNA primase